MEHPRPIRVGVFVYLASDKPFVRYARCDGPCDKNGLSWLGYAAFCRRNAGSGDSDELRKLSLIEASDLSRFAKAIRQVKRRNAGGNH